MISQILKKSCDWIQNISATGILDWIYAILEKYIDNATENECDISFIDLNKYHNYKKNQIEFCGTEIFDSQKLLSQIDSMNFEEFAKNRHSVRDFAVDTVDESIIKKIHYSVSLIKQKMKVFF